MLISRSVVAVAGVVASAAVIVGVAVGCAPVESPEPTPTVLTFASEEEAFAAAEEVYRAYNDELDQLLAGDEQADPLQYLTGSAYELELTGLRDLDVADLNVVGKSRLVSLDGVEVMGQGRDVKIVGLACVDSSELRLLDENGNDITPESRDDISVTRATFIQQDGILLISERQFERVGSC